MKLKDIVLSFLILTPIIMIGHWESYDKYAVPIISVMVFILFGYLFYTYWQATKLHKQILKELGFPQGYKPSLEDLQSLEKQLIEEEPKVQSNFILEEVRKEITVIP